MSYSNNKLVSLDALSDFKSQLDTVLADKQDALTTSTVSDGTINKAIGFDSNGDIVKGVVSGGTATTMIEITYADLVTARTNGTLVKGCWYRITDYVTTTAQTDTTSANNAFDVLVLATSTTTLSEEARAIAHSGDTYFTNCNLLAWKIWYCLDNDTDRFAWADSTNGKGVIYRMIDEKGNDLPYDFKNIKFVIKDIFIFDAGNAYLIYERNSSSDGSGYYAWSRKYSVSGTTATVSATFYTNTESITTSTQLYTTKTGTAYSSTGVISSVKSATTVFTFDKNGSDLSIDTSRKCYGNVMKPYYTTAKKVSLNGNVMYSTSSTIDVYNNTFGVSCYGNIYFVTSCYDNVFVCAYTNYFYASSLYSNYFEKFYQNYVGSSFYFNTFAGGATNCNTFSSFYNNICGKSFSNNLFGTGTQYNTFGNNVSNINAGNSFSNNIIGNSVAYLTVGNYFQYNTVGNYSRYLSTGTYFRYSHVGDYCQYITLGDSGAVINYVSYLVVENGVSYVYLNSTDTTASSSNMLQNIHIHTGVAGSSSSNRKTITIPDRKLAYSTEVYADSSTDMMV